MSASQTDFIDLLTQVGGLKSASLVRIGVLLRKEGLLQVGGRGPHAPRLSFDDAVTIFIGATVADHTTDAPAVVRQYSNLAVNMEAVSRVKGAAEIIGSARTFRDFLVNSIFSIDFARTVFEIRINRTFPEARVVFYGKYFHETYSPSAVAQLYFSDPNAKRTLCVQSWVFIPGGIITQLAGLVTRYEPTPEDFQDSL